jgi:hypothetical protein
MAQVTSVLVDGISTIATHNGVHRIVMYRLGSDQKPEQVIELQLPEKSTADVLAALGRLSGPKR